MINGCFHLNINTNTRSTTNIARLELNKTKNDKNKDNKILITKLE